MTLQLACPAASPVHPAAGAPSVVCGVLARSNDGAQAHGFQSRGQVNAVMDGDHDRNTVRGFCAGTGIPGSPVSYCACAVWRAGKEAGWASRRGPDALRDEAAVRRPAVNADLLREATELAG